MQAQHIASSDGDAELHAMFTQLATSITDIHNALQNGLLDISMRISSDRSLLASGADSDYRSTSERQEGPDINVLLDFVPPVLVAPDERDALIRSVKKRQRIPRLKLLREEACADARSRRYDPAMHNSSFLQAFVEAHGDHEDAPSTDRSWNGASGSTSHFRNFKDSDVAPLHTRRS